MKVFKYIQLLLIIFTLFGAGCKTNHLELIFKDPFDPTEGLVSITVIPENTSVPLGYSQQYTAIANYKNQSTLDITQMVSWTSHDTDIAIISNSPNSKGFTTTHNMGSAIITATIKQFSGNTTLFVTDKVIDHFTISPIESSVPLGLEKQFTATCHYSDGSTDDVTSSTAWISNNNGVATINSSGLAESVSLGSTTIIATYNSEILTATLTVIDVEFLEFTMGPINPSVTLGVDPAFTATEIYTDGSTYDVTIYSTWTSSNTSVANINSSSGIAETLNMGTSTITAYYGGKTASTTLTVTDKEFLEFTISPIIPSVHLGIDPAFTATVHYTDGSTDDVTTNTTWTSSKTSVANINASGIAETLSLGSTTITAVHNGETATTTLSVTDKVIDQLIISPANPSVPLGVDPAFTATAHYTDGTSGDVTTLTTWTSSNTSVANINSSSGIAETLSAGATAIFALYDGVSVNTILTVTPK